MLFYNCNLSYDLKQLEFSLTIILQKTITVKQMPDFQFNLVLQTKYFTYTCIWKYINIIIKEIHKMQTPP